MVSILNGLSAAGAGVSTFAGTAGLEAEKADLARQNLALADQLATSREVNVTQPFQASQQAAALASEEARSAATNQTSLGVAGIGAGATLGAANIQGATSRAVANINANAPPDTVKLLNYLGMQPTGASAPAATPSTGTPDATATPGTGAPTAPDGTAPTPNPAAENLINKTLGLPAAGSEDAIRRAIAQDVKTDPAFKYKSAGDQGAEIENRLAIAQGKMTDPASRTQMAAAIASYQMAPLSGFAAAKPGGPETMAQVLKFNPDYQEARYPEVTKAMSGFGSGTQGDKVRFLNVGVQHLDGFDQAAAALGNNDVQALNNMKNWFQQQFGVSAPTTFDGLKQIVGTEIEKAVAGGIGSAADRDRLIASLNRANSPAQLQDMTNGFRSLMAGQLVGLKTQYEDATGFKGGPFAFENKLVPATIRALSGDAGQAHVTPAAPTPVAGTSGPTAFDEYGRQVPTGAAPPNPDLMRLWGQ